MDECLGYGKNDRKAKQTGNHRNGKSTKRLKSEEGEVTIDIPYDRAGKFELVRVTKHDRISDKIRDCAYFI